MDNASLNKAATIEKCMARVKEEYLDHESELKTNYSGQDSLELSLRRACETSVNFAMHITRMKGLRFSPQRRDAFKLITDSGLLSEEFKLRLRAIKAFENIAIHDLTELSMAILKTMIENNLEDGGEFGSILIRLAGEV